jgi:hypothetical protein
MEESELSVEFQFRQVGRLCEDGKKTVILTKEVYYKLIDELKEATRASVKSGRQYYILKSLI